MFCTTTSVVQTHSMLSRFHRSHLGYPGCWRGLGKWRWWAGSYTRVRCACLSCSWGARRSQVLGFRSESCNFDTCNHGPLLTIACTLSLLNWMADAPTVSPFLSVHPPNPTLEAAHLLNLRECVMAHKILLLLFRISLHKVMQTLTLIRNQAQMSRSANTCDPLVMISLPRGRTRRPSGTMRKHIM